MIRLFSQIRNKLIESRKTRNYLLYAAGEVFLVMIGILLALQVNNWNNERQRGQLEIKIYEELLTDLKLTKEEAEKDMRNHMIMLSRSQELIDHLVNKRPLYDGLGNLFGSAMSDLQFYPKTSGFENLSSVGLDIISNDSIRIAITSLYQLRFQRLIELGVRQNDVDNIEKNLAEYYEQYTALDDSWEWPVPAGLGKDSLILPGLQFTRYEQLLHDDAYQSKLHQAIRIRSGRIWVHQSIIDDIDQVTEMIKRELIELRK